MKAPLILYISSRMDNNRKTSRNENGLIRLSKKARETLGLNSDKFVELWPDTNVKGRIKRSRVLTIYQAYSKDLKELKTSNIPEKDYCRVGFVTTNTFNYICGGQRKTNANIWISDSIEDCVIGSDPEFVLLTRPGEFKYAAEVESLSHEDQLGSDGPLAELRPDPDVNVDKFVGNIRKLLRHHPNRELIEPYDWMTGCLLPDIKQANIDDRVRILTIGGHIHFGFPLLLTNQFPNQSELGYDDRISKKYMARSMMIANIIKILDEYIAIPLMRVEGIDKSTARREHYGRYAEIRQNEVKVEYRTLSGVWMAHPKLSKAVLGTSKALVQSVFKIIENENYEIDFLYDTSISNILPRTTLDRSIFNIMMFNSDYDWKRTPLAKKFKACRNNSDMENILHNGNIKFNKVFYDKLGNVLTDIPFYEDYKIYIEDFLKIVSSSQNTLKKIDYNLKHTWVGNKQFIV